MVSLNLVFDMNLSKEQKNGALSMIDAMAMKTELRAMKNQRVTSSSKVTERKGCTLPNDELSIRDLSCLLRNATVKSPYYYGKIPIST